MNWKRTALIVIAAVFILSADDCGNAQPSKADVQQAQQTQQMAAESNAQVGMPGIVKYTEKRRMREIYEQRDRAIATFTYVPDMSGRLWHLCDSIGYGIPYATQYSNPTYLGYSQPNVGVATLQQPEPNGLFMPTAAEGTWIDCADPKGKPQALYVEPRVIVSPFRLRSAGEYQGSPPPEK